MAQIIKDEGGSSSLHPRFLKPVDGGVQETVIPSPAPSGIILTRQGNMINATWKNPGKDMTITARWAKRIPVSGGERVVYLSTVSGKDLTSASIQFNPNERINAFTLYLTAIYPGLASSETKTTTMLKPNSRGEIGLDAIPESSSLYKLRVRTGRVAEMSVSVTYNVRWGSSSTVFGTYSFSKPNAPTVSFTRDNSIRMKGKFNWSISTNDTDGNMFRKFYWESALVRYHNSSKPPSRWTEHGEGYANTGELVKQESFSLVDLNDSYTRWFRVKSIGPGGESDWVYSHHTYANPKEAVNVKAQASVRNGNSGYTCKVSWDVPDSFMYPCDSATVMYARTAPQVSVQTMGEKVVSTLAYPGSASYTDANTVIDSAGIDSLTFVLPQMISANELLWARIRSRHDDNDNYSIPVLFSGAGAKLSAPALVGGVTPSSTNRINLQVQNNSGITNSFTIVYFRQENNPSEYSAIGLFTSAETTAKTLVVPEFGTSPISVGLQTFVADYSPATARTGNNVTYYTVDNIKMASDIVWEEGVLPVPPKNITLTPLNVNNINVLWDWAWDEADAAELSWADHEDAWKSTAQPETYELTNIYNGDWNIADLDVGQWWVRIRLGKMSSNGSINWSLYSDSRTIKLASAPAIPSLVLSAGAVTLDDFITCYWAYISTDGTAQMQADICEVTYNESTAAWVYGEPFAKTNSEQHITFQPKDRGWQTGETHHIAVRVISMSGETSEGWSTPVAVKIVEPITCTFTNTSLVDQTTTGSDYVLTADSEIISGKTYYTRSGEGTDGDPYVYTAVVSPTVDDLGSYYEIPTMTIKALTDMPLSLTVSGAGVGSTTTILIERSIDCFLMRPDETRLDGFAGEIIVNKTFNNDGSFTITQEDLIGYLDDGAAYRITAIARDSYGQTAETSIDFEVHWAHQAIIPDGEVVIDSSRMVAILTPQLPAGAILTEGDTCDIYRLSIDPPQLIYEGAEFGETYIDQYPALGIHSGYRFVYKTANGDYTTATDDIAWYDTLNHDDEILDAFGVIIDFAGIQVTLPYNVSLSHKWEKDFIETKYLGGSVQGDWNPAVSRTSSVNAIVMDDEDFDPVDIESIRQLAVYPGVCHIRTPEGSSFACNIDVSEDRENKQWVVPRAHIQLSITRVDSPAMECLEYEEWREIVNRREGQDEEEEETEE